MSLARGPLFVLHGIFATVLVLTLLAHLGERERDVEHLKSVTRQERDETARLTQDIEQQQALLKGVSSKDPYVIELLAREKLQYGRPGEISPPPVPAIDKLRHDGSK